MKFVVVETEVTMFQVSARHVLWPLLAVCWICCSEAQDLINIQKDPVEKVLDFLKKYGEHK